ncbi:MAG: transcriptional repressor [Endomicrobiales bacterium]|nr:transcriptional repressor [Endomicrobiales bacterium]
MITKLETLKTRLLNCKLKPTYQRLKILSFMAGNKSHPSIDLIYKKLKNQIPTLSKTTLYNTLEMFARSGLVGELTIGQEVRFDGITNWHHHFVCENCGAIIDINVTCPNCQKKEIEGHLIKQIHGYFRGLCKKCR